MPGTTNGIRIYEESASEVVVVAEARASVGPPIRPTINGTITLTFNEAGVDAVKSGNLYPAYEVYQDRGFGPEKVATFDERTVDYLIGGPTGSVFRAGQSVAGNARDILTGRWVYG